MSQFVAFLRGANVGGKTVKMEPLRKTLEEAGFKNVKTLLASGNVIFETNESDQKKIEKKIETLIKKTFGFDIDVILRSEKEISALVKADPFKKIKVTPDTRLYVTFLSEKPIPLDIPYKAFDGDYQILQIIKEDVLSTLAASPKHGTPDVMDLLGKLFGKKITTRNWNTVLKIKKSFTTKGTRGKK